MAGSLTPLQLQAAAGLFQNQGYSVNANLTATVDAYKSTPLLANLIAAIGNAANFSSGRQLSAWLGLVPKQHSSGGKEILLGISKRGDTYLRTLLIHGARAVFNRVAEISGACSSDG